MDLKAPPSSHGGVRKAGSLNLKQTSKKDGKRNVVEAPPSTPGRPVFSFSVASRKKSVPSKWNDAEKWLQVSDPDTSTTQQQNQNQNHHLHGFVKPTDFLSKKSSHEEYHQPTDTSEEKVSIFQNHNSDSFVVLEEKLVEPSVLKFECTSESFLFKEAERSSSRDIGTEMTPLGTSTCPTPFKALSPPRHNTPATRSGPLDPNNSLDIQECHLAKLKLNWTSREDEEEDISKSLRHFENECRVSVSDGVYAWEQEHDTNYCLRYQREETKIQAWVDLQNAKAEAQSRKLEVKIQKMRSAFEEKLMRKMANVHKKADELRAAAQLEHIQQLNEAAKKTINQRINMHHKGSSGCFPCNNLRP